MAQTTNVFLLMLFISFSTAMAVYNIKDFGAQANGRTDSAKPLLRAWAAACGARTPATVYVPTGKFLVSRALLQGPCNNAAIRVFIDGTLVAPPGYSSQTQWIVFKYVQGVSIFGGTLDGQGKAFWDCKMARRSCPTGSTSFTISQSKNILVRGLTLLNSEGFQMSIYASSGVTVQNTKILAPENSANTDGIHVQMSSGVTITGTTIMTGDDCISMGAGSTNVWIEGINCGPGHGISIGSLGGMPREPGVENITVTNVVFTGTQNGMRVKTWGKPNAGFVRGVTFQHAVMRNVQNPIVIDQNYCPNNINCPGQSSGIKINGVLFNDIQGSSATQVAMTFNCSPSNPCTDIRLQNIKLTYQNKPAQSFCKNLRGLSSGFVIPSVRCI